MLDAAGVDDRQARFLARFLPDQASVRAFIRFCVWDSTRCDDIFQEVSLVLWREFDRYDSARPFGAWARGVAAKTILRGLRQTRQLPTALSPAAIDALELAFAAFERSESEEEEALRHCLDRLPDRSRDLVHLRYRESLKVADIASRIMNSSEAVQKALTRVRDALRKCVERRLHRDAEAT